MHPNVSIRFPGWVPVLLAALVILPVAGPAAGEAERPNIVWINCEDLNPVLGCYGDELAVTPNLDRLAKDGILYRNAFANSPVCSPARSCLITGVDPVSLGSQYLRCEVELPAGVEPFPAHLKRAGYRVTSGWKTDYNFSADGLYDYRGASLTPWRELDGKAPFFSFLILGCTHEGPGNFRDRYDEAVDGLPETRRHDPAEVRVPPYFPDTPKMRELLARYHDLATVMDGQVGRVIRALKEDGLWDDTIVWFFSDHGHGLPRHKRWLLDSGLRVPLLVRVPEKYRHLAGGLSAGSKVDRLVSFGDFAPTVLDQAGVAIPDCMGKPFLGERAGPPPTLVYGTRDRVDDLFELSRAVHDGRYVYVRHFMPHLPYIQGGKICSDEKESYAELRRARDAGLLDAESSLIWAERKPREELYDLEADPHEVRNLAGEPAQRERIAAMREALRRRVLDVRDTGFLAEAESRRRARAAGETIHRMARDPSLYDLRRIHAAAERAADGAPVDELVGMLGDRDSGVRYWGAVGFRAGQVRPDEAAVAALRTALSDPSPSVAIAAAVVLCLDGRAGDGLPVLLKQLEADDPAVMLEAARGIHDIGEAARPSIGRIEAFRRSLEGGDGKRRYRDFNHASFTGWSLEAALIGLGVATPADFGWRMP